MSTSSTAIRCQDFSPLLTDTDRDRWTGGKLRHVVAALDGAPVAITVDKQTGHTEVGVRLVGMRSGSLYVNENQVIVERDLSDGTTQRTAFRVSSIGATIVPLDERGFEGAKWRATRSFREETTAALVLAQREHGDAEGRDNGKWTARVLLDEVHVSYEPRDRKYGADRTAAHAFAWWPYRLDRLADEVAKREARVAALLS